MKINPCKKGDFSLSPPRLAYLELTSDPASSFFFFFKGGRGERHRGIIGRGHELRLVSSGMIFTRARVSLALIG